MPLGILVLQSHIYERIHPQWKLAREAVNWLTSADHDLDLLVPCPQIVLVRYLAVTSFDSGSLVPKDLADLFWLQLGLVQPESFIPDGGLLNFVTYDEQRFVAVCAAMR